MYTCNNCITSDGIIVCRCTCGKCEIMPMIRECKELQRLVQKMEEDNIAEQCITLHPGFSPVCLNIWSLQAAYFNYRQQYGSQDLPPSINE